MAAGVYVTGVSFDHDKHNKIGRYDAGEFTVTFRFHSASPEDKKAFMDRFFDEFSQREFIELDQFTLIPR